MKPFASRLSLILALLCAAPLASAEQYYKWTDAQGVVHYTKTPPPETASAAKPLTINSAPASSSTAAPASATADQTTADKDAAATPNQAQAEAEKETRRKLCAQARQELEYSTSNGGRRVREVRGEEKRIVLPAERQRDAEKWRAEIAKNCN